MRHLGVEGDRIAGPELELFEADFDAQPSADQVRVLLSAVADQRVLRTRFRADVVDDDQELEILVGRRRQPFPADAVGQADRLAPIGCQYRVLDIGDRRFIVGGAFASLGA